MSSNSVQHMLNVWLEPSIYTLMALRQPPFSRDVTESCVACMRTGMLEMLSMLSRDAELCSFMSMDCCMAPSADSDAGLPVPGCHFSTHPRGAAHGSDKFDGLLATFIDVLGGNMHILPHA